MQTWKHVGIVLLCIIGVIASATSGLSAVPGQINYQGRLTDDTGVAVPDETYDMRFRMFNAVTGGSQLWNPPDGEIQNVTVTNGIYNILLGRNQTLDSSVFDGGLVWLEVHVYNTETTTWEVMAPRLALTSTAFSFRASDSEMLEGNTTGDLDARYVNVGEVGGITSAMIADNSVSAAALEADSVGPSEITSGAVGSGEIIDGSLTAGDLQDGTAILEILDDDGPGSGLDADYLDGYSSSSFILTSQDYGRYGVSVNLYEGSTSLTSKYVNATGDLMTGSTAGNMLQVDNQSSDGTGNGIYARTYTQTGAAVAGFAMNSGAYTNEGGRFMAYGDDGRGVYGYAPDTGSGTNYGGYFEARGGSGQGVYGRASNTGAYTNYGGRFQADGSSGIGVYGYSPSYWGVYGYGASRGVYGYAIGSGIGLYGYAQGTGRGLYSYSYGGDGVYGQTYATNKHAGYFYASRSDGLAGAALYARAYNSTANGIAFWAHNDHTTSTDATAVLSNDGSGPLVKGFGGNGGEDEFRINNDGLMIFYNDSHIRTVQIDPSEFGTTTGSQITLYDGTGVATIELDGDFSGDGRITTQELQITGGSDLSEQFDIHEMDIEISPGMVVSIDPDRPGRLKVSRTAYDNKVAGIISGAGGINTGMLMGQRGSEADGQHPVALTGRVYCQAETSTSPIQPGDLLTTSSIPGHAMKVTDHSHANGAILGKAMTGLEEETGLILVLVSLQ